MGLHWDTDTHDTVNKVSNCTSCLASFNGGLFREANNQSVCGAWYYKYILTDGEVLLSKLLVTWILPYSRSCQIDGLAQKPSCLSHSDTWFCQRNSPHRQSCWTCNHCLWLLSGTRAMRLSILTSSPFSTQFKLKVSRVFAIASFLWANWQLWDECRKLAMKGSHRETIVTWY